MPCVYLIQNKLDYTIYVGKADSVNKRWTNHKYNHLKNVHASPYLYNAFAKYGIQNFDISVLETFETVEEAFEAEIFWIGYFRLIGAKLYNLTLGGEAGPGRKPGFTTSDETRNLIKTTHRKKVFQEMSEFENDFGHLE